MIRGVIFSVIGFAGWATCHAQDTPDYFRQNCMNCHTIGGGPLAGPDLKDVTQRQDREWLIGFMMDPASYLDRGDPYAQKILEQSRNVRMPALPGLDRERAENLLDMIEAESALPESQFKGLQLSTAPFTEADREHGRELFLGLASLENGGGACIACHAIQGQPAMGGGRLGPELTNIFERLQGRKALSAWLVAPGTETMQPIFKDHPLNADEIHALVAFFDSTAGEPETEASASRITFVLLGLLGAAVFIFALDAIWKRRFQAVRRPLVDSSPAQQESHA